MCNAKKIKMGIRFLAAMVIWALSFGNAISADAQEAIDEDATLVEDHGPIMEMDSANNSIIIREIQFVVADFMLGDERYSTQLIDKKGNKVGLDYFKEKQWVFVSGYKVSQGVVYAEKVQAIEPKYIEKDNRSLAPIR